MSGLHPNRPVTSLCLLAAAAMPIIFFGTQIAAAPFYPGYSFSMTVGKHARYSVLAHPWIFNAGEMLTGFAAIVSALGLEWTLSKYIRVV
jgi:hypothetical protein